MVADLARNWWLLALRGAIGILFGIGALLWPGATLAALVIIFGAYVLVDGIFAVVAGFGMRRQLSLWWVVVLEGLAGIILGVLTFRSPDTTAFVLLSFIAAWSIITGIFEIATAVRIRKLIENEWLMILSGVVSIIFGALLVAQPGAGALSIVWLIGLYALFFGLLTLILSFRLRGMQAALGRRAARAV